MNPHPWLVRHLSYPTHERLRGRSTLRELREFARLAEQPPDVVRAECARRLRELLIFAGRELPYFADVFERFGVDPRRDDPYAELMKLRVLQKADVRKNAERMVYRGVRGGPIPHSSGGTTGDTLHFFIDRIRQAQTLAARLFVQRRLGVQVGERRAYLWGSPIESNGSRLRHWRDRLLNEILLDAFEMSPPQCDDHLKTIQSFKPRLLYGYPSAVALLAAHARDRFPPGAFPWLRVVVLTGEEITDEQTALVREVFDCRVVAEYGSRETGLMAHDCPRGRMHIFSPHVHIEIMADGLPLPPGNCGEIVCTTLTTRAQPMIRYRVGDVGSLDPAPCPCGLPFPTLRIEGGKITGFIALPDGRLCHGAVTSHVLRDQPGVVEFKTYQRAVDRFEVLLAVNEAFNPATIERVRGRYRKLFGEQIHVDCRTVARIPPDPSGKRRYFVSDVAPAYGAGDVSESAGPASSSPSTSH